MAEQGPIERAIMQAVVSAINEAQRTSAPAQSVPDYVPDAFTSVGPWVSRQNADSVDRLISAMVNALIAEDRTVPMDVVVEARRVLSNAALNAGLPV